VLLLVDELRQEQLVVGARALQAVMHVSQLAEIHEVIYGKT
jgi:hypothetical protein